jgi:hypothetical protein
MSKIFLRKIINFPNMCSYIPASPAYGVYISQLIRYARASSNYSDFLKRHLHLRNRLLDQGYKKIRLIRSLKKFIFRYQDLVEIYSVSAETIISDACIKIKACFSDEDGVSGDQNNCYWLLHSESIARCKHHMQEKLVYCCTCLENL